MTRDELARRFDVADIPQAYYREELERRGEATVYVAAPFVGDAKVIVKNHKAFGQDIEVKRLWFWHRWFNEKL